MNFLLPSLKTILTCRPKRRVKNNKPAFNFAHRVGLGFCKVRLVWSDFFYFNSMIYLLLTFSRWVGICAGILTTASLIPPLVKLIKEKNPEHVPLGMLVILLGGLCLWIYYGLLNKDWPILVTNCLSLAQNLAMLTLRFKYQNKN